MIITVLKVNFYSSNFKKNEYEMGSLWYCYFEIQNPRTFKLHINVLQAEIF